MPRVPQIQSNILLLAAQEAHSMYDPSSTGNILAFKTFQKSCVSFEYIFSNTEDLAYTIALKKN